MLTPREMLVCALLLLTLLPIIGGARHNKECSTLRNEQTLLVARGDIGIVTSQMRSHSLDAELGVDNPEPCTLMIKACKGCHLFINIDTLSISNSQKCPPGYFVASTDQSPECFAGCDYVIVHETDPAYRHQTLARLDKIGESFTSMSSSVTIIHCQPPFGFPKGNFTISFQVKDNTKLFRGSSESKSANSFTSPNYPRDYALNGDVYTYIVWSHLANDRVRMVFDDWDLGPHSHIKVTHGYDSDEQVSWSAKSHRPVFVSASNRVVITLYAVKNRPPCCGFIGFKATYNFVPRGDVTSLPSTECSTQREANTGGLISFVGSGKYPGQGGVYDCTWVIKRFGENSKRILATVILRKGTGWISKSQNRLEIRDGVVSTSQLIALYGPANVTSYAVYNTSRDGLYIRQRGEFFETDSVEIVYTIASPIRNGMCEAGEFQCSKNWCVNSAHVCDGVNHCPDGSDERTSLCSNMDVKPKDHVTAKSAKIVKTRTCTYGFYCAADDRCMPKSVVCDHRFDCRDASDEFDCGTASLLRCSLEMLVLSSALSSMTYISWTR